MPEATMYVNTTQGLYHCFGCQAEGDVLTALQEVGKLKQGRSWNMDPNKR
jgi:DNA primase